MEQRMPLSATALMLTDIQFDQEPSLIDAAVQVPLMAGSGDAVAFEALNIDSPMVCHPVTADEWVRLQTGADDSIDVLAMEAVMEMGSEAWSVKDETGDDLEGFTGMTLMGGPAPPPPGSPIEADPIVVEAPVIDWFEISYGISGVWHFEGEVIYSFPAQLDIVFGGAIEHTIKADSSGAFLLSLELPPDTSGMVTVQAFTPEGVPSNLDYDWII
jgi:hypothetical protein